MKLSEEPREIYKLNFLVSTNKIKIEYKMELNISLFRDYYVFTLDCTSFKYAVWNQVEGVKNKNKEEFNKTLHKMIFTLLEDISEYEKMTDKEKQSNNRNFELIFEGISKKVLNHYFKDEVIN